MLCGEFYHKQEWWMTQAKSFRIFFRWRRVKIVKGWPWCLFNEWSRIGHVGIINGCDGLFRNRLPRWREKIIGCELRLCTIDSAWAPLPPPRHVQRLLTAPSLPKVLASDAFPRLDKWDVTTQSKMMPVRTGCQEDTATFEHNKELMIGTAGHTHHPSLSLSLSLCVCVCHWVWDQF